MSLLQMSFAGAVIILVVTVIRAAGMHKLPKTAFLVLWGVALVRLLIPYTVPSALSVYSLWERLGSQVNTPSTTPAAIPVSPLTPPAPVTPITPVTPGAVVQAAPSAGASAVQIDPWTVIWAVGAVVCVLFFAVSYFRCRREFKTSLPVDNDVSKEWLRAHRLKRPIAIRYSDRISAPLTYGVFRPVILMPKTADWSDGNSVKYILAHEYVHICRFDAVTKLVLTAALCVHWFNPAVWLMYVLANRDMELSCDEAVIHLFGEHTKSAYALTLIRMEEVKSGLTPLCNNFSKNVIEERVVAIMKMKKASWITVVIACLLVGVVGVAFATSSNSTKAEGSTPRDNAPLLDSAQSGTPLSEGRPLTAEEIERVNSAFEQLITVKTAQGEALISNPLNGFFSSYYTDVRDLDFGEFIAYYPAKSDDNTPEKVPVSEDEFQALKALSGWFWNVEKMEDMPVPIHRHRRAAIDETLMKYAGITTADLNTDGSLYLPEYDAWYNFTSDFGAGYFTCTGGTVFGDTSAILQGNYYEDGSHSQLSLVKEGNEWHIKSFVSVPAPAATGSAATRQAADEVEDLIAAHKSDVPKDAEVGPDGRGAVPGRSVAWEELQAAGMQSDFLFCSGAGGWSTWLTVSSNGAFTGHFEDGEMGSSDPQKYPDGTAYVCDFAGVFSQPVQVDEYTLSVQVERLEIQPREETIEDGIRYLPAAPYGMKNADDMLILLPGKPMGELSEDIQRWLRGPMDWQGDSLPFYALVNVNEHQAFCGWTTIQS